MGLTILVGCSPKPSEPTAAEGYYKGPMKGKGSAGSVGDSK